MTSGCISLFDIRLCSLCRMQTYKMRNNSLVESASRHVLAECFQLVVKGSKVQARWNCSHIKLGYARLLDRPCDVKTPV